MVDDFDDIFDEIKKYFKLDSNIFDVDFIFIPESETNSDLQPKDKKVKGFKISYHYESGMDKPEIKIEGNLDENKIQDYLKNIDLSKQPTFKRLNPPNNVREIDAGKLSLESQEENNDINVLEPYLEINNFEDYSEIMLEIPGMSKEDVTVDISEEGSTLIFTAENVNRKFMKNINLPFISSIENSEIDIKNGLALLKVHKLNI